MLKRWQVLLIGAFVAFAGIMSLSFYGASFLMSGGRIVPGPLSFVLYFLGITGVIGWFAANLFNLAVVYAGFILPSRRPSRRKRAVLILGLAFGLTLIGLRLSYMLMSLNGLVTVQSLFSLICYAAGLAFLFITRDDPANQTRPAPKPARPEAPEGHALVTSKVEAGPDWHETLLTALRNTGVQEIPRPKRWPLVLAFVVLSVVAQIVPRVTGYLLKDPGQQLIATYIETPLLLVLLAWPVALIRRRLAHLRMRRAEEALKKAGDKRPIFYLRSFGLDDQLGRPSILELFVNLQPANAEQTLAQNLSRSGPVIAIGRPGEKLPALGAARFYVSHDLWQEKVAEIANLSQLVVWASGTTPGLQWEISHLVRSLPPEKLILWAHPQLLDLDEDERESEWTAFVRGLGQLFPMPLPMPLGKTRFFAFDKNFNPIPYGGAKALTSLLTDKKIPPHDAAGVTRAKALRKWVIAGGGGLAGLIAVLFFGIMAMRVFPGKPDPLSWNLLANELISDERSYQYGWDAANGTSLSQPRSPQAVIDALKVTEAALKPHWFGKTWQDVPPGKLALLSRAVHAYEAAFEAAHDDTAMEALFYGQGPSQIFLINGLPMVKKRLKLIDNLRRALESCEAEWREVAAANPGYVYPERLLTYIVARQKLLDSEAAILRSLANHPDNWSLAYNAYNERVPQAYPDSYRDQVQVLIDDRARAARRFRETQEALR